jgi:hypothetical protein
LAIIKKKKTRINYKFVNPKEDSVSKERQIKRRIKVETIYPAKIYDETLISDNLKTYKD